jgi:hypothetical protein
MDGVRVHDLRRPDRSTQEQLKAFLDKQLHRTSPLEGNHSLTLLSELHAIK